MHKWIKFDPYKVEDTTEYDLDALIEASNRYKKNINLSNDFSYYQRFLDILRSNPRCDVRPLNQITEPVSPDKYRLCIRHDMDGEPFSSPSLSKALFDSGLSGSFYVLHTAEYYGRLAEKKFQKYSYIIELLRAIQDDYRCEVGLHNDGLWVYQKWKMDGSQAVTSEINWLRSNGLRVIGTAAHNSAPVYGAENFELFQGRAFLRRKLLIKNMQIIPLQSLSENELGLMYEANYPDFTENKLSLSVYKYLSSLPSDAIRNPSWMKKYLLDNPICRWGHDYNIWLIGVDKWVISGSTIFDPVFVWDATLEDLDNFLNQVNPQKRIVCHVHPVYIFSPDG